MKEYVYEFLGGRQNHRVDPVTMKNEFTIDNLIVVYYNRFSPRFRFTGERHNFYEFYYVAENEMVITVDGENFLLNAGEFITALRCLFANLGCLSIKASKIKRNLKQNH